MKNFLRLIALPLCLVTLSACEKRAPTEVVVEVPTPAQTEMLRRVTLLNVAGREFSSLSVHPNSQELLFLESRKDVPEFSKLLRYHFGTGKLQYYTLPTEYHYLSAAFSPSGKFIVLWRMPVVHGDRYALRAATARSEIVVMRSDGSEQNVLALREGLKMRPVMSHDDRYIAYWRGEVNKRGGSLSRWNEVWEFDFDTGTDKPFGGKYYYRGTGRMQYFHVEGKLLVNGYDPIKRGTQDTISAVNFKDPYKERSDSSSSRPSTHHEVRNGSFIFAINRGATDYPEPCVSEVPEQTNPSLDANHDLYFVSADYLKTTFYKQTTGGVLIDLGYPWGPMREIYNAVVLPDSSQIAYIFVYRGNEREKRGIALFDLRKETWTQLSIPNWEDATPIALNTPA